MTDPADVECPTCLAPPGDPCEGIDGDHPERVDAAEGAWGSDLSGGVLDLDGDGIPGALDFDDPSNRW